MFLLPTSWELTLDCPTDPFFFFDPRILLKHNKPQAAAELEGRAMNEEEQRLQKAWGKLDLDVPLEVLVKGKDQWVITLIYPIYNGW